MVIDSLTEFCGKSNAGLCSKKLGCDADCKSGSSHQDKDKKPFDNVMTVISCDTHIDDLGDDYRNKQVKHNFQKFEERCKDAFFLVVSQVDCERSHFVFPPFFLMIDNPYYSPVS